MTRKEIEKRVSALKRGDQFSVTTTTERQYAQREIQTLKRFEKLPKGVQDITTNEINGLYVVAAI